MGYYTNFTLEINVSDETIIPQFREECDDASYALDDGGDCSDSSKWYDCESDLKTFSVKHPEVLFTLSGEGEETGDLWILYVKNGKSQHCQAIITYPAFDESLLK